MIQRAKELVEELSDADITAAVKRPDVCEKEKACIRSDGYGTDVPV
mgnify:CR=1 FL=1